MRTFIPLMLIPALALAGCGRSDHEPPVPAATLSPAPVVAPGDLPSVSPEPDAAASASAVATSASTVPGAIDRDPTHAVATWRNAMERRDWATARSVFGQYGAQSGMSAQAFAAAWDKYRIVDVTVGKGEQEGAAGSSFYEAPVSITGLKQDGTPYHLAGTLTLRRVNDVDGATPEQLRWHIERTTLQP